ncbi:MAG: ATP-binding protein [Dehalococcoidales bacterium]
MSSKQHQTGKSVFLNLLKNKRTLAVVALSLVAIIIGLALFFVSINKPYIGVSLHITEDGWVVQDLYSSSLAEEAGIKIGDKPIEINGQPADVFLQAFEKQKQFLGIGLTDLVVENSAGQIISVSVYDTPPPVKYILENIPFLLICLVFWFVGFYVYINKPKSTVSLLLLLSSLAFGWAVIGNVAATAQITVAIHMAVIGTTLGPWLLFHFLLVLPEERSKLRDNHRLLLIYIPAILTLILYPFIGFANNEPTILFRSIRSIELFAAFLAIIIVSIYNYTSAVSPRTRQQMKLLLYSCIVAVLPFLLLSLLPLVFTNEILIPIGYTVIFTAAIPIGIGYSITTRKLLDISVFINRHVVYGLISIIIALVFTGFIIPILLFLPTMTVVEAILISLVLGFVASGLFGPLKITITAIIDKFFYKDKYDYYKVLRELSSSLNAIADISTGSTLIINVLAERIRLNGACLIIKNKSGEHTFAASTGVFNKEKQQKQILELLLNKTAHIMFPDSAVMVNPEIAFLVPLVADKEEIGYICLSPKTTEQRYTSDDLFLIQALAPVAAVSLRSWLLTADYIAEQKQTQARLLQEAETWQTTFDAIPMPISLQSNDFKILRVNKAFSELFAIAPQDVIGKHCYEIVHESSFPIPNCPQAKMLKDSQKTTIEVYHNDFDEYFEVTVSPIKDADGVIDGAVHIMRNITQVKKAEEEKRILQEKAEISGRLALVGEMAAGIAHEINNPLTGVIGFSDMLLEKDMPPDMKEHVKIIAESSHRVADIIKRLLTFSRQHKPMKTVANINSLIDNILHMRSYVLKSDNINVVTEYDQTLPLIEMDPGQIQQVFLNLIINAEYAVKKADRRGELVVKTAKLDNKVRISLQDNGTGISEETKKRLFQPFFTTKPVGEGTGLGLSLSHSIITEHGGTLSVESEPGEGATFIIELPITNHYAQNTSSDPPLPEDDPQNPIKTSILVVDDEITVRQFIKSSLSDTQYSVDTAANPVDALQIMREKNYDIIILDIRMPNMNGQELYKKIIEIKPQMSQRVIFITGDLFNTDVKNFLEMHNLPSISKPFDRETLEEKIKDVLS